MRVRRGLGLLAAVVALVTAAPAHAALSLTQVYSGLPAPMFVTSPPGDSHRLFIVERSGVIQVAVDGVVQAAPFLDIHTEVWTQGEAGLISMAFDPNYATNGLFYVYFVKPPTGGAAGGPIEIEEFHVNPSTPNVADASSERTVLEIAHSDASNHYGGTMHFGPDGDLYFGAGDGGGADNQYGNAQNTKKSLLGKLMRIDPHVSGANPYSIPAGNPFFGQPLCNPPSGSTNCPEIYAWGLRNPFRWSFDDATGDIAIGDVGQSQYEEIDYVPHSAQLAGDNFGWPCYEGPNAYQTAQAPCPSLLPSALTFPVAGYSHSGLSGSVAITGGLVVRDPAVPTLAGRYLYADFYQGVIHSLQLATPSATGDQVVAGLPKVSQLVSFGEGGDQHVYVVSLAGAVYRLDDSSQPQPAPGSQPSPPPSSGGGTQGSSAPPSTTTVPARDSRPPRLSVRGAHRQAVGKRGFVRLSVACDEACTVHIGARDHGRALRGRVERLRPGRRIVLELHASVRVRRALARGGTVVVSVRARDSAGNVSTRTLTVRVPA